MREIAYTLSYIYPAMFQYTGGEAGGQVGPEKVDVLAQKMKERVSVLFSRLIISKSNISSSTDFIKQK